NIRLAPSAANGLYHLSTVLSRTYTASAAAAITYAGTAFTNYTTGGVIGIVNPNAFDALKLRVLLRFKTMTNPQRCKVRCSLVNGTATIYTFPNIRTLGTDATGQLLDCGGVHLDMIRNSVINIGTILTVNIDVASNDGNTFTVQ